MQKGLNPMRSPLIFAVAASVAIAGCSGGGGSTLPPVQPPSQQNANTDAQSAAQAAMTPVSAGDLTSGLIGGAYGSTLSVVTHKQSVGALSQSCVNRHERIVTQISQTETKYETKFFYDNACTQLAKDVIADVTIPSHSSESIVRTATWFNQSGTQLANRAANFSITGSTGAFAAVLTSAFFVGTSQQPTNQFGGEFDVAAQNANTWTIAGDHADIYNDVRPRVDASFGVSASLQNATASVDNSGNVTFAGSRSLTLSMGSLYGLTMPSAPPFAVSGGNVIGTGNANGSVEFDAAGQLIAVDVTVTTVKGFTVVMTSSGSPGNIAINGVVTNSGGTQVATFTVDQYGDGVITFANGSQALIIDWRIVG
jgi:hypothetical protein